MKKNSLKLLLVLLLIVQSTQTWAQTNAVNISKSPISIRELITEIEKQTGYLFIYSKTDINPEMRIKLNTLNKDVKSILNESLPSIGLTYEYADNYITLKKVLPQTKESKNKMSIKGSVVDKNGEPIIGAVISEKGNGNNGTITDLDGNYTLSVPANSSITISFVGYTSKTVAIDGKTTYKTTLEDDMQSLDELVVVGYGVQKKKLVTGSSISVKGEDLQKLNTTSPLAALQSQSPGINITKNSGQPGSGYKVTIRGIGTTGNATPLYIVDGVTVSGIDHLNPSDIESIDVLKDAASSAIYGARAANGVVLVTTKQGKAGKSSIDYEGFMGIQNLVQNVRPLNAQEYRMIMDEALTNSKMALRDYSTLVPNWSKFESGESSGTNWLDEMLNKNAPTQNHSVSVRGGSETSTYSMGLSYTNQEGTFGVPRAPYYTRYTALINSEHSVIKNKNLTILKIGENINYSYTERRAIGIGNLYNNDMRSALCTSPFLPIYDENGNYHYAINWEDKQANPMGMLDYQRSQNKNRNNQLTGNFYLELQPIKGLKYRSSFGINLNATSQRNFTPVYSLSATQYNSENRTSQTLSTFLKCVFENTISYDFKLKEAHQFNTILGTSAEWAGIGEDIQGINYNSTFDDFKHAYLSNSQNVYSGKTELYGTPGTPGRLLSFFGRVNYNYNETYMATLVLRADGSSNFAPKNRWGYFPSISAGWVVSNESFMQGVSGWLDFLKLRASWGQNGNQDILPFQYLSNIAFDSKYIFGTDKVTASNGAYPSILPNEDIKWETSEQINIGLDARFLRSRLGIGVDLYNKATKDWLVVAPVLGSFGTGAPFINGGDVTNRGIELSASWNDKIGDFRYSINANAAYNRNRVDRIANGEGIIHGPANVISHNTAELYRAQVGFPIGYFWGYKTDGLFQTPEDVQNYASSNGTKIQPTAEPGDLRFIDQNDDGILNDNDKVMIGDPNPDYTFGLSFNLNYKGFDLNVVTNGVAGNQIIRAYRSANLPYDNYTSDILDRWNGPGTSNSTPRVTAAASNNELYISDRYIEDGSYLRISNVTLGYDFKQLFKSLPLNQIKLYVSAQNLYTFTKYKGLDPEIGYGYDNEWASGIDLGFYPVPRVYMVGLSIKY